MNKKMVFIIIPILIIVLTLYANNRIIQKIRSMEQSNDTLRKEIKQLENDYFETTYNSEEYTETFLKGSDEIKKAFETKKFEIQQYEQEKQLWVKKVQELEK